MRNHVLRVLAYFSISNFIITEESEPSDVSFNTLVTLLFDQSEGQRNG